MILDALIDWATSALVWLGGLLPSGDVFTEIGQWSLVMNSLAAINYYLPIFEVFTAVLAVLYVLPLLLGATLVLWLVGFIRGGSSRA